MTLKQTLSSLMVACEKSGKVQALPLERGLIIELQVTRQRTTLRLLRTKGQASRAEWRTVLENWPAPMPPCSPEEIEENGRMVLAGSWPTPTRLVDAPLRDAADQTAML